MDEKTIFKTALDKWGYKAQLLMTIEECSELIKAICKLQRNIKDKEHYEQLRKNLLDELVDVQIMINQMKIIFDSDEFKRVYEYKLKRLEGMLNG